MQTPSREGSLLDIGPFTVSWCFGGIDGFPTGMSYQMQRFQGHQNLTVKEHLLLRVCQGEEDFEREAQDEVYRFELMSEQPLVVPEGVLKYGGSRPALAPAFSPRLLRSLPSGVA